MNQSSIFNNAIVLSVVFAVLAGTVMSSGVAYVLQLEAVPAMVTVLCSSVGAGAMKTIALVLFYKDKSVL